jgi:hypothetical protein
MNKHFHQNSASSEVIVSFSWLLTYLKKSYRVLTFFGITGFVIGGLIYLASPKIYEATFILKLPSANAISPLGEIEKHIIKPVPTALDVKKTLLQPANLSNDVVMICGFEDTNEGRKKLVNSISSNIVNYDSGLQVIIRLPGADVVKLCANRLSGELLNFSNNEKDRYVDYANRSSLIKNSMLVNENAQLTAPIRISDGVVYPRLNRLLLGCLILGLLLSCLIDWVRYLWSRAR